MKLNIKDAIKAIALTTLFGAFYAYDKLDGTDLPWNEVLTPVFWIFTISSVIPNYIMFACEGEDDSWFERRMWLFISAAIWGVLLAILYGLYYIVQHFIL